MATASDNARRDLQKAGIPLNESQLEASLLVLFETWVLSSTTGPTTR
jgi:hypothetical protein